MKKKMIENCSNNGLKHVVSGNQDFYRDRNGYLHGEYRRFYEHGGLEKVAHYNHGRRDGVSQDYDEDGVLVESYRWKNHRIVEVLYSQNPEWNDELIGTEYLFAGR